MAIKVCLDAGHYGKYNRSPCNKAYYESDMAWKLHLLMKRYLEQYGIEVILTRGNQANDLSLSTRGVKSIGCDLFLSYHSNATGNGIDENTDFAMAIVPLNGKGDELGNMLAECIESCMGTKQDSRIWTRRGNNGDYYGVIRGAVSVGTVGIILEHSFHTNTRSTNWLLNDDNLDKLARAEAATVARYFGLTKETVVAGKNEWIQAEDGRWWYKHSDGTYTTNGWELINGKWYLFDAQGWMLTGWQQVKGTWYYLCGQGCMENGWKLIDGKWYFMDTSGAMRTGWLQDGENWYFLGADGAMVTGWQQVKNHWYHLAENGIMDTGLFHDTDGRLYYLADDGHMCRTNESGALV